MRVLHVIQELLVGGAERVVASIVEQGSRDGSEFAVASHGGPLEAEIAAAHYRIPMVQRRPWRLATASLAIDRTIRAWHPNIVHSHNPAMAAAVSLATLRGRRVPSLVSVHGVPEEDWPATARLLKLARLPAVACGPGVASALREHSYDVAATVPNGISPPPAPAERSKVIEEFGLDAARRVVVAIGRLAAAKNHTAAVRAISHVPDASLLILGEGSERARLEALVRAERLTDRVVLAGFREDARAIAAAADAVVFTSRAEGLPLAALEALAAGSPVVAVGVRGLDELLTDGENAVVVPPEDVHALADGLRRVLTDRAFANRLAAGGRTLAADYTEERMVAAYLGLYRELAR